MDYKITKAALVAATLCLSSNAIGQDWTSGGETLYFNFDKAENKSGVDLTKVREVLQSCSVSSISVTGHTDRSGSQAYNQPLSERRANVIKAEIASWGLIDGNAITTRGAGENELAFYTEDGVKEQLNRRAEVQFGFSQPCSLYYTAPAAEPVIYSDPVTVSDPVIYSDPVTVSDPVIYSDPVTVSDPVIYNPTPTPAPAPAPTPAPAAPAPVVSAPPPIPAPISGGGFGASPLLIGGIGAATIVGAILILDDDDDDDEPASP